MWSRSVMSSKLILLAFVVVLFYNSSTDRQHSMFCDAFVQHQHPLRSQSRNNFPLTYKQSSPAIVIDKATVGRTLVSTRQRSRLYLDFFGLGPTELFTVLIAVTVFYGPGKLSSMNPMNNKGKKEGEEEEEKEIPVMWVRENQKTIDERTKYASKIRQKRAWERINQAIENNDPTVMEKLSRMDVSEDRLAKLDNVDLIN